MERQPTPAESESQRRNFLIAAATLAALTAYSAFLSSADSRIHLIQGVTIMLLSGLPCLLWLREAGQRFPVFEPTMLLCATTYGVPLLSGHGMLSQYPEDTVTSAAWAVIAFQTAAIAANRLIRSRPGTGAFWVESTISPRMEAKAHYGLLLSASYMIASQFTNLIPWEWNSVLRAVFLGIGTVCTFIAARRWGEGKLGSGEKTFVVLVLVVQSAAIITSLMLVQAITLAGVALLGFVSSTRRMPWAVVVLLFAVFAVLHNGKAKMRDAYWEKAEQTTPPAEDLPRFFTEWIGFGLEDPTEHERKANASSLRLLERSSLIHILCLVVQYTPERQPFLEGKTYGYVLPQFVPRMLWPSKPRSHIATYELSIYYGLQDEDATERTTIAFGLVPEAYANFGLPGVVGLGFLLGWILRTISDRGAHSPMLSLAGLLMILLASFSLSVELTMAAWLSSLFQALVVVLGIPWLLRHVFHF